MHCLECGCYITLDATICNTCGCPPPVPRPAVVNKAAHLGEQPNGIVRIGTHFDGTPLVLGIGRSHRTVSDLMSYLELGSEENENQDLQDILTRVSHISERQASQRDLAVQDGVPLAYVAPTAIGNLLGETLPERFLGTASPIDPVQRYSPAKSHGLDRCTSIGVDVEAVVEGQHQADSSRRLWVGLEEGAIKVVRHHPGGESYSDMRPFVSECLTCFEDPESPPYRIHRVNDETRRTSLETRTSRLSGLGDKTPHLKTWGEDEDPEDLRGWGISRASMARGLIHLAGQLGDLHARGLVHGDLKPANILATRDGLLAFDALNIKIGNPSGAVTPGWASPEQLMGDPVGPASDVFSLGIITAQLCQAVVFGESLTFVVPTGGRARTNVSLFKRPRVFIDPHKGPPVEVCKAWIEFIESCLHFDSRERVPSADAFATRMQTIMDTHGLPGVYETGDKGPGIYRILRCSEDQTAGDATESIFYVVSPTLTSIYRSRRRWT